MLLLKTHYSILHSALEILSQALNLEIRLYQTLESYHQVGVENLITHTLKIAMEQSRDQKQRMQSHNNRAKETESGERTVPTWSSKKITWNNSNSKLAKSTFQTSKCFPNQEDA